MVLLIRVPKVYGPVATSNSAISWAELPNGSGDSVVTLDTCSRWIDGEQPWIACCSWTWSCRRMCNFDIALIIIIFLPKCNVMCLMLITFELINLVIVIFSVGFLVR